jgi:hypothetical protein
MRLRSLLQKLQMQIPPSDPSIQSRELLMLRLLGRDRGSQFLE